MKSLFSIPINGFAMLIMSIYLNMGHAASLPPSVSTQVAQYEAPVKVNKIQQGQSTHYFASDDFITGINRQFEIKFKNKTSLLSTLDIMRTDFSNTAKLTEVFRQIEQSPLLTRVEKINWLKTRINELPAPFIWLLAKFTAYTDLDEAFKWRILSSIRMKIDAGICQDYSSAFNGTLLIDAAFRDGLVNQMAKRIKDPKRVSNDEFNRLYQEKQLKAIPKAIDFHKRHPYPFHPPYWLAHHAPGHITKCLQGKLQSYDEKFIPKGQYGDLEEKVLESFQHAYQAAFAH